MERIRFLGLYRVYYSNHFQGRPTQMDRYTLRDHLEILQAPRPVLGATDMFLVADWVDPSENPAMHEDVLAPTDELVDSIVTALRTAGIDIDR